MAHVRDIETPCSNVRRNEDRDVTVAKEMEGLLALLLGTITVDIGSAATVDGPYELLFHPTSNMLLLAEYNYPIPWPGLRDDGRDQAELEPPVIHGAHDKLLCDIRGRGTDLGRDGGG